MNDNKKKLCIFIAQILTVSFLMPSIVMAAPANPEPVSHTQADGKEITVIKKGDEYFSYFTDDNENLLVMDEEGDYSYVTGTRDGRRLFCRKAGSLPYSGSVVKESALLSEGVRREYAELSGHAYKTFDSAAIREPLTLSRLREDGSTSIPLVAVVVSFNNIGYSTELKWSDRLFFDEDSLRAYYLESSEHKLTFEPAKESCRIETGVPGFDEEDDGIIHVTLDTEHKDWSSLASDKMLSFNAALEKALDKASGYIDVASYDKNGNKIIDSNELGVIFIIAGYEAAAPDVYIKSCGISDNQLLWSYRGGFSSSKGEGYIDGVRLTHFIAVSEYLPNGYSRDKIIQEPLGILYHEFGHFFGLPDLYDTKYLEGNSDPEKDAKAIWRGYDVNYLSIMGLGNWAKDENENFMQVGFDAWSRFILGWTDPELVTKDGKYRSSSQMSDIGYKAILIETDNPHEYYILETRCSEGLDTGLSQYDATVGGKPLSANGILLWHIDDTLFAEYFSRGIVNSKDHRPMVMPLFPEYRISEDNIIDDLSFSGTVPMTWLPFWDSKRFQNLFKGEKGYEDGLNLPLYGKGEDADDPDKRFLSGICIHFLDEKLRDLSVEISGISKPEGKTGEPEDQENHEGAPVALSTLLTQAEISALNDSAVSTASKNSILKRVDDAIEKMVGEKKTISFDNALKAGKKSEPKEYWVKMVVNRAMRYDGRKHLFNKNAGSGKSKVQDMTVKVYYCEKSGGYSDAAPAGDEGWTEAAVKNAVIRNAKAASFDEYGCLTSGLKSLAKTAYISGVTLQDKALNKTLGKALNKELKILAKKLKADKPAAFSDGELNGAGLVQERRLIIPVYPLYIGNGENTGSYTDGNGKKNEYSVNAGVYNSAKKRLRNASVAINFDGGYKKKIRLNFSAKKEKDLKLAEGDGGTLLAGVRNYFGLIEYE